MHIAIDVRTVETQHSGVGYYVTHLLEALHRLDRRNRYTYVCTRKQIEEGVMGRNAVPLLPTRFSHESHPLGDLWEHFFLPSQLRRSGVDLFHGPAFVIPFWKRGYRTVATIHDLVVFRHPETVPRRYSYYMQSVIRMAVRYADALITVSQCTARDLYEFLNVPRRKVHVIYSAASPRFRPVGEERIRQVRQRYGLDRPFILHVGNLEPKKNLPRLLEGFVGVRRRFGDRYQLVVAGKRGWLEGPIFHAVHRLGLESAVRFLGYVPAEDLPALYSAAALFVFPSLYEGFGLPVLEAMGCGTPTVTSWAASLPEVAGDAAVLVDPHDAEDIGRAMVRVLESPALQEELREKGLQRQARFSWEETARKTLEVYHRVCQG